MIQRNAGIEQQDGDAIDDRIEHGPILPYKRRIEWFGHGFAPLVPNLARGDSTIDRRQQRFVGQLQRRCELSGQTRIDSNSLLITAGTLPERIEQQAKRG